MLQDTTQEGSHGPDAFPSSHLVQDVLILKTPDAVLHLDQIGSNPVRYFPPVNKDPSDDLAANGG